MSENSSVNQEDWFKELVNLVEMLLSPSGCKWDRKQTLDTLKNFLIEESYEVLDAIETQNKEAHCEELGDVLFQIVFQSALRSKEGAFTIDDVCRQIVLKMKRRHPHIFGNVVAQNEEEVKAIWQIVKAQEKAAKGEKNTIIGDIPKQLPALLFAEQLGHRVAAVGFDWPDVKGVREKLNEEIQELDEAISMGEKTAIQQELGDVLFTLVRLAAKLGFSSEDTLRFANQKFIRRFQAMEHIVEQNKQQFSQLSLDDLNRYWQEVKQAE